MLRPRWRWRAGTGGPAFRATGGCVRTGSPRTHPARGSQRPRPSHHAIGTLAINRPRPESSNAPTVKSIGKRYQFQYGTLVVSHAITPSAPPINTRLPKETGASDRIHAANNAT